MGGGYAFLSSTPCHCLRWGRGCETLPGVRILFDVHDCFYRRRQSQKPVSHGPRTFDRQGEGIRQTHRGCQITCMPFLLQRGAPGPSPPFRSSAGRRLQSAAGGGVFRKHGGVAMRFVPRIAKKHSDRFARGLPKQERGLFSHRGGAPNRPGVVFLPTRARSKRSGGHSQSAWGRVGNINCPSAGVTKLRVSAQRPSSGISPSCQEYKLPHRAVWKRFASKPVYIWPSGEYKHPIKAPVALFGPFPIDIVDIPALPKNINNPGMGPVMSLAAMHMSSRVLFKYKLLG